MQGDGGHANALNFIRLFLAASVVVSHAWNMTTGRALFSLHLGDIAVAGFFAISGYLITGSRLGRGLAPFLWRRFLRIMPGLWACLAVVAFVIVPVSTLISGREYPFGDAASWAVSNSGIALRQYEIGDTLAQMPETNWDAPLWTLFFEVLCYLCVGALLTFRWFRLRAGALILVLATALVLFQVHSGHGQPGLVEYTRWGACFAAGLVLKLAGVVAFRARWACVSLLVLAALLAVDYDWFVVVAPLPLAYLLMWLGTALPVRVGSVNDVSYGVYIYGWPMQQILVVAGAGALGVAGFAVLSLVAVVPIALASWFIVERPALRIGTVLPTALMRSKAPVGGVPPRGGQSMSGVSGSGGG